MDTGVVFINFSLYNMGMKIEYWKPVVGYEGLYEVSSFGRVRNVRTNRVLSPIVDRDGYLKVHLSKNGHPRKTFIHVIVSKAFIPNPNNYPCINHKDENKLNNCVENLEWCTVAYNNAYSKSKKVIQYTLDGQKIKEWPSTRCIEREIGYNSAFISKCCRGIKKTAYGFKWSYAA